jgi:hypothetical protein
MDSDLDRAHQVLHMAFKSLQKRMDVACTKEETQKIMDELRKLSDSAVELLKSSRPR